jgi:hypothetical protein
MKLGQLLADERTLRLAVLNACEGARTNREDPFAGVAASLVRNEIPSVVAMQFEITDEAAILFAGGLYAALARGSPVDAALASARKAIWADYNDIEWGTPVLFMRVPDGRIFDVRVDVAQRADVAELDEAPLDVRLRAGPEAVKAGDEVSWHLTITNVGDTALYGITALGGDGSILVDETELRPPGAQKRDEVANEAARGRRDHCDGHGNQQTRRSNRGTGNGPRQGSSSGKADGHTGSGGRSPRGAGEGEYEPRGWERKAVRRLPRLQQ